MRVRVTIQCPGPQPDFFYRLAGAENWPLKIGSLSLPPTARLRVVRFDHSVGLGGLVDLVTVKNATGLLTSLNMFVRSTAAYQEGCFQATIDSKPKLWLSSGLEDFFFGSYFHSMPNMELGNVGFHLDNSSTCPTKGNGPNALAAVSLGATTSQLLICPRETFSDREIAVSHS